MGAALNCVEPQVMNGEESEFKTSSHNDGTSSVATGRDVGNMADLVPRKEHKVAFQDFFDVREAPLAHGLETHGSLLHSQILLQPEARRIARTNSQPADGRVTLQLLSESVTPLFFELVEYLAASPRDCVPLCNIVSHSFAVLGRPISNALWSMLYMQRWPAFHECLRFHGTTTWKPAYQDMMQGKVLCALEIYHREKKLGFTMSCMPAKVRYDKKQDAYLVKYVSASDVPLETIPVQQESRVRFLQSSARCLLQLESSAPQSQAQVRAKPARSVAAAKLAVAAAHSLRRHVSPTTPVKPASPILTNAADSSYSYRSIEGIDEGLRIGAGVEIQWKMQSGSPFGWWYGELEDLERQPGASVAKATIVFKHFPPNSRWYRMQVVFGDGGIRDSNFGGKTGGIRSTAADLQQRWYGFLPTGSIC
jgi:hypothetical protein